MSKFNPTKRTVASVPTASHWYILMLYIISLKRDRHLTKIRAASVREDAVRDLYSNHDYDLNV